MATKKFHLVGVGGVGMAGLALLLKSRGHSVTGCDLKPTPRTRWLEENGVRVFAGHSPEHLAGVDEVVVTPAVRGSEPELAAARLRPRPRVSSRGETLARLFNESEGIAVCGSHGKTTTATWTAKLLRALGEDVSWCIGGETGGFPVAGAGRGPLVVEADESDGTLALYRARTLVVTNCEFDHPDHFASAAEYAACYETAKKNAADVIESERLPQDFPAVPLSLAPHNRANARAAVEVALRRGHSAAEIAAALPAVVAELPDRRFQKIAEGVYADYAHHPTEIRCAVGMARRVCRGVLRVLFQPHRHSRTKALLRDFPAAFAGAGEIVFCPTYAAFEPPVEGGGSADLYAETRKQFAAAGSAAKIFLARSCAEAWEHARNSARPGDVALLLGAGDIIDLAPAAASGERTPPRRLWIGSGSNTWRSDLNLDVSYTRTSGPADAPGASLGIPWMAGVPGTVGGWIKMNAGAFGHSVSELIDRVKVDGRWLSAAECGFGYRRSAIDGEIQDFSLKPFDAPPGAAADYLRRRPRFPPGTFGSFFKNPEGGSAGRLLETAGAKSMRVGGAYVWSGHANVIVRGEGATPSDVLALATLMRDRVKFRLGVDLEPEVCGVVTPA
ncbi:MAG: hypothetical protein J6T01_04570 [Kiritimatiellae bacterium]|nr:hypothetical protein [Kiritimatiellia bacterium]